MHISFPTIHTLMNVWQYYVSEMTESFNNFYATVHCVMIGQWGPKRVAVCEYWNITCDINEVCAFVGLHCNTCIVMHGRVTSWSADISEAFNRLNGDCRILWHLSMFALDHTMSHHGVLTFQRHSTILMETAGSFDTSVCLHWTTPCHIMECWHFRGIQPS